MTFSKHVSISISADGAMERREVDSPAIVTSPAVRVSMPAAVNMALAARLLRRLADELEAG